MGDGFDADDEFLTTAEVVNLLPISRPTFYKLLRRGEFEPQPIKVGGFSLFLRDEVELWIEAQQIAPGTLGAP